MTDKKTIKNRIRRVLLTGLLVFAIFCVLVLAFQDAMIFLHVPYSESFEFLRDRPGFIKIEFEAENGRTFHGVKFQAYDELSPLLIYFGGNGEVSYRHMHMREHFGQWTYFTGFNYLFIDYVGYGRNDGRTSYRAIYEGALAVFDFAVTLPNIDSERIVTMGFSLGTAAAVYLAAHRPVAGLILASPFASGYDLFNNVLPIFHGPMRLLVRQRFPSYRHAPQVDCPALIIASRRDEIVPFSSSERLAGLFPGDVYFMELEGLRHNDIFGALGVHDRIRQFLEDIFCSKG